MYLSMLFVVFALFDVNCSRIMDLEAESLFEAEDESPYEEGAVDGATGLTEEFGDSDYGDIDGLDDEYDAGTYKLDCVDDSRRKSSSHRRRHRDRPSPNNELYDDYTYGLNGGYDDNGQHPIRTYRRRVRHKGRRPKKHRRCRSHKRKGSRHRHRVSKNDNVYDQSKFYEINRKNLGPMVCVEVLDNVERQLERQSGIYDQVLIGIGLGSDNEIYNTILAGESVEVDVRMLDRVACMPGIHLDIDHDSLVDYGSLVNLPGGDRGEIVCVDRRKRVGLYRRTDDVICADDYVGKSNSRGENPKLVHNEITCADDLEQTIIRGFDHSDILHYDYDNCEMRSLMHPSSHLE